MQAQDLNDLNLSAKALVDWTSQVYNKNKIYAIPIY